LPILPSVCSFLHCGKRGEHHEDGAVTNRDLVAGLVERVTYQGI
jgi:hypothetical protein